jgi:glycosyltransferase involved in cell wall biosynthesis
MTYAVILPTRNGASTIKQTLDSILRQSLHAAQICVVDDGSTDGTSNMLKAFVEQDAIKVVTLPDQGYDIRRVPFNLNVAYSNLNAAFDYLHISDRLCELDHHVHGIGSEDRCCEWKAESNRQCSLRASSLRKRTHREAYVVANSWRGLSTESRLGSMALVQSAAEWILNTALFRFRV